MAVICGTPTPVTMRVVQMEPGPMPTLTAIDAGVTRSHGAVEGGDVAGDQFDLGQFGFYFFHGFEDEGGVAVGAVDGEDVDFGFRHFLGALEEVAGGADGGA